MSSELDSAGEDDGLWGGRGGGNHGSRPPQRLAHAESACIVRDRSAAAKAAVASLPQNVHDDICAAHKASCREVRAEGVLRYHAQRGAQIQALKAARDAYRGVMREAAAVAAHLPHPHKEHWRKAKERACEAARDHAYRVIQDAKCELR